MRNLCVEDILRLMENAEAIQRIAEHQGDRVTAKAMKMVIEEARKTLASKRTPQSLAVGVGQ